MAQVTPSHQRSRALFWVVLALVVLLGLTGLLAVGWETASPATQGTVRIFIDTVLGRGSASGQ